MGTITEYVPVVLQVTIDISNKGTRAASNPILQSILTPPIYHLHSLSPCLVSTAPQSFYLLAKTSRSRSPSSCCCLRIVPQYHEQYEIVESSGPLVCPVWRHRLGRSGWRSGWRSGCLELFGSRRLLGSRSIGIGGHNEHQGGYSLS